MVTERELPSFWQERRDGLDIVARFLESEIRTWLGVVPGRHKARLDIMVAIDAGVDVGLNPPPAGVGDVGDVGRIQVVIFDLVVLKGIIGSFDERVRLVEWYGAYTRNAAARKKDAHRSNHQLRHSHDFVYLKSRAQTFRVWKMGYVHHI